MNATSRQEESLRCSQKAKAYLREVAAFVPTNAISCEAVRRARYAAWLSILQEAPLDMVAYMQYRRMVEVVYGPRAHSAHSSVEVHS